jgi:hypothetical protein
MATLRTTLPPRRWSPVPACVPLLLALALCPLLRVAAQTPAPQGPSPTDAQAAEQSEAQDAADAAHAQQVLQLINQAEADYNAGVANYNANHLDAARADFDAAVDPCSPAAWTSRTIPSSPTTSTTCSPRSTRWRWTP